MDPLEIKQKLQDFTYWYHKIELAPGITTPGFDLEPIWNNTRKVRDRLNYKDKTVLDIASFDGLFTFEAEKLGASVVVAADCLYKSFSNFLFCREILKSKAIPYYNVSPYELSSRLDVFMQENYEVNGRPPARLFDIVQHLGLLYHLRDPMLSLSQARSVLKTGGTLFIETDIVMESDESFMLYNGLPHTGRARDNYSVWWVPTRECLFEMLEGSMFQVDRESYSEIFFQTPANDAGRISTSSKSGSRPNERKNKIGRAAVLAKAVPLGSFNEKFEGEICRTYRNPGLDLERI